MSREYVWSLIERMTVKETLSSSRESISWNAHMEARTLTDASLYPELKNIILSRQKKSDKDIRSAAYYTMGCLFKNCPSTEYLGFYLSRLDSETDKYILSSVLDRIAALPALPEGIDIRPVIRLTSSDKWLIRHSAINALGACPGTESREALSRFLCQTDEKRYRYEIIYASAAMGRVGTADEIPLLRPHTTSRVRDIRYSAAQAIDAILQRIT